MSELMECRGLYKNYWGKPAINGIDLVVPRGRIIGLLGPNGSGKTTLIKMAAGLITPSSGQVLINGEAPGAKTKAEVSYLPDRNYLNDWMTSRQLIDFFSSFYRDFRPEKAFDMLKKLGIGENDRLKTMSKGTKEKMQLILVMSRESDLYLLDEPIGGVDAAARDYIISTIIGNYRESATVIISTHLIADVEQVLDDALFISGGKIIVNSSVDEIREREGKSVDQYFREVFRC